MDVDMGRRRKDESEKFCLGNEIDKTYYYLGKNQRENLKNAEEEKKRLTGKSRLRPIVPK